MKIRRSFVTNSSSSSYLLGTAEDNLTKDIVYRMVRDLYKDLYAIKDQLMAMSEDIGEPGEEMLYCEKYELFWNEEYQCFDEDFNDREARERLIRDFGVDPWAMHLCFRYDVGWLDLDTYEEYEAYWKTSERDWRSMPFYIDDHGNGQDEDIESVFSWYVHCDGVRPPGEEQCRYCYLKDNRDLCRTYRQGVAEGTITEENEIFMVLGRFCIISWDGDIPHYAADRLSEICRFSCQHMG